MSENDVDTDDLDADVEEGNRLPAAHARAVLEYITKNLVENPDEISVEVIEGSRHTTLNLRCAQGDLGRVIGKRGRLAQAIRLLVRAAAVRDEIDVDVEFLD